MPITNVFLSRWKKGYRSAQQASSISTYGRREGFVALTDVEELSAVDESLRATLTEQSVLQNAITLGIEPTTDAETPYKGVFVRDAITAPNISGSPTSYRVVSITASIDAEGFAQWAPQLESPSDVVSDRTKLWLKRIGNGTLAGRSKKASLVKDLDKRIVVEKVQPILPPPFSQATVALEESGRWVADKAFRLTQVDVMLQTPGSTATTVTVRKNGVVIVSVTLAAGRYHAIALPTTATFKRQEYMTVATTAVGTGAKNLTVELTGGPAY